MPEEGTHECCFIDNKVQLKCGHGLPLLSAACKGSNSQLVRNSSTRMPVETGYVGKHKVIVLRDSGCSTAVVRRSLVEPNQFTGNYQHCILIDGTVRKEEVANIYVDTPFYEGHLEVLCMEQPIYDLIIGNTHGVRDPFVENIKTLSDSDMAKQTGLSNNDQSNSKATVEVEQGVQMRAPEKKKTGKVEPLIVVNQTVDTVDVAQGVQTKFQKEKDTVKVRHSNVVDQVEDITEVTKDVQMRFQEEKQKGKIKHPKVANQIADITLAEIKEARNGDETLSVPIRTAESGEKKAAKNSSIPLYLDENNILYREFQSQHIDHGKLFKQSVDPKDYRKHSLRLENDSILSDHLGITQMTDKIQTESHWPGVQQDNIYYCSSC